MAQLALEAVQGICSHAYKETVVCWSAAHVISCMSMEPIHTRHAMSCELGDMVSWLNLTILRCIMAASDDEAAGESAGEEGDRAAISLAQVHAVRVGKMVYGTPTHRPCKGPHTSSLVSKYDLTLTKLTMGKGVQRHKKETPCPWLPRNCEFPGEP